MQAMEILLDEGNEMNALKSFVGDRTISVLVSALVGRGFTWDQAESFLPEASCSFISAIKDENSHCDLDSILETFDISGMVFKTGLDRAMVTNGLKYVIPGLMDLVRVNNVVCRQGKIACIY